MSLCFRYLTHKPLFLLILRFLNSPNELNVRILFLLICLSFSYTRKHVSFGLRPVIQLNCLPQRGSLYHVFDLHSILLSSRWTLLFHNITTTILLFQQTMNAPFTCFSDLYIEVPYTNIFHQNV